MDEQLQPGLHKQFLEEVGIRYSVLVPDSYDNATAVPLILALHYGGQVTPFYGAPLLTNLVAPGLTGTGAIMVAPDNRGDGWDNPQSEARIITLLDHIRATYKIDEKRILITGYSMGGIGTWYLAARNQELFSAAVPVAGRPQADSAEVEWKIPVFVIHGRKDEVLPMAPTEEVVGRLKERGVDIEMEIVEGVTHYDVAGFSESLKAVVPWIERVWREHHD